MTSQPNPTDQEPTTDPAAESNPVGDDATCDQDGSQDTVNQEVSEVDSLKAEVSELNDRWLRSQAELENVRRRARRDVEEQLKYANTGIVGDLLEVVENLDRAVDAGGSSGDGGQQLEGLMSGVKMVSLQFSEVLKKYGCQKIDSVGQVFDPNVHEAVQMVPNEAANGTVVQELRSGYKLHDRVIRPAQVMVSSGPAE